MPTKKGRRKIELSVVGIQYRVTISTRRYMKARVDSKPFEVEFKREPDNSHDANAIAVWSTDDPDNPYRKIQLGYLPREVAAELAPKLDKGQVSFGKSFLTNLDVDKGIGDLQVEIRT